MISREVIWGLIYLQIENIFTATYRKEL